jgi:hypothetical protein
MDMQLVASIVIGICLSAACGLTFDPFCTTHLPGTGVPAGPGVAASRGAF